MYPFLFQLFDMKKFQSNVNRELRRSYPDRRRLETQCLSAISFVKTDSDLLDCPIWVLIINVVAMDMLKSKLPPGKFLFSIKYIAYICSYVSIWSRKIRHLNKFMLKWIYVSKTCSVLRLNIPKI